MKTSYAILMTVLFVVSLFIGLYLLVAGASKYVDDTTKAIMWIETHQKPIRVYNLGTDGWTYQTKYVFVDSIGAIYNTGYIKITLKDTIK